MNLLNHGRIATSLELWALQILAKITGIIWSDTFEGKGGMKE